MRTIYWHAERNTRDSCGLVGNVWKISVVFYITHLGSGSVFVLIMWGRAKGVSKNVFV